MAVAAPAVQATTSSFGLTCDGAKDQMSILAAKISQIKLIAQKKGHTGIVSKCNEAQGHVSQATSTFGIISTTFLAKPWEVRTSSHSTDVRYRLGLCGNILSWIFAQPEVRNFQGYISPISQCQTAYVGCQQTFGRIWSWPAPPTKPSYAPKPKPSQAHHRDSYSSGDGYSSSDSYTNRDGYYRRSVAPILKDCPAFEDACPINSGLGGDECLDLQNDVSSCGGCVSKKEGENCLDIKGANGVGCLDGSCVVLSVLDGYTLSENGRPVKASSY